MSERDEDQAPGVKETAPAWDVTPPLRARPVQGPVDWDELIDDIRRRFPKTLARLAE